MNRNATLFAILALLFGCALAADFSKSIKLDVYKSSTQYWVAVAPTNEGGVTKSVEMLEASSDEWVPMIANPSWGYFQMYSTKGEGFHLPLSFRLTSIHGEQVILDNVLTSLKGADLVQTAARFARNEHENENRDHESGHSGNGNEGESGNSHPATQAPTQHSSHPATQAPTQHSSHPATQAPTHAPTAAPTQHSGHSSGSSTPATQAPTAAPTQKAGHSSGSSTPATSAPTSAPGKTSGSASGSSSTDLCAVTSTSSEPVKLLVPLYVDPGSAWDELVTAAESGTPIIAIINPDSGPVSSGPDSSYTTYMGKFADANIEMVGYIATGYGDKSVADVEAEVDTYFSKYPGLKGIFLDECSADASEVSHYTQLNTYILGKSGYVYNIINPGTQPDQGYLDAATNIVVFESPATQWASSSNFDSWVTCAPSAAEKSGYKYKFSAIGYAASQSQMTSLITEFAAAGMGMVYVTDGSDECCVYNNLAEYFSAEASAVNSVN